MINPVILFIPVSSSKGIGEYTRSMIIADALQEKIPQAEIHFILNKNMKSGQNCNYQTHFSEFSATKDTPLVNSTISKIRPNIVIFDCAGRSQQFAHAKRLGAKVVFISQHRKKRARGLTLRRMLFCDLHWVVQPDFAIQPLSTFESFKLKILGKMPPKNIGPILPRVGDAESVLASYSLTSNRYFLFSAGSGGHKINEEFAADIFYRAALELQKKTDLKIVMVFGAHYSKALPTNSDILCLSHLSTHDFLVLQREAAGRVLSAGSTLLQVIELKLPSVAIAISKDQPTRLKKCAVLGLALKAECEAELICQQALNSLNPIIMKDMQDKMEHLTSSGGVSQIMLDIGNILGLDLNDGCDKMNVERLETNNNKKNYLFFISQDYSFPVLRPLQKEILARGDQVKWFVYGDEIHPENLLADEQRLQTVKDIIKYNPVAVFVPGNVVPSFIPGLKIQVFHGLPSTKAKKNGQLYHYIIRGMFDLYCTQGPESTEKFNQLKNKYNYFQVAETGWSKLDPLFQVDNIKKKSSEKTIFFASTFSPRFSKAQELYPLLTRMMKQYSFNWYITLHPKMNAKVIELYKSIKLDNVKYLESTELTEGFINSELMLCDTSSIIYEFLTQQKPVITFQTEKDEAQLINITNLDELEANILKVLENPEINSENIRKSVSQFHPYNDGCSSQRILNSVESMIAGHDLPKKNKPFNFVRNLRLRKELKYWRI